MRERCDGIKKRFGVEVDINIFGIFVELIKMLYIFLYGVFFCRILMMFIKLLCKFNIRGKVCLWIKVN